MVMVELAPVINDRSPSEISGSAADIAQQIVDILKTKAKVI